MWPLACWLGRFPRAGAFIMRRLLIPPYFGVYNLEEAQLREWMILDMFNTLSPRYESSQTLIRVRGWFRDAGLVDAQVHVLVGVQRLDCRQAFLVHQTAEPDTG